MSARDTSTFIKPSLPLGILLPALTLGSGLVGALLVLFVSQRISEDQVEELTGVYLMNVGYAFAASIQSDLRNRENTQVQNTIKRASSTGVADTAMLADENNMIMYSTGSGLNGQHLSNTPFGTALTQLELARAQMQPIRSLSASGESLIVLIPVRLSPREGELIALRVGMLGLTFDIEPWMALTYSSIRLQSLIFLLFAICLSALMAWLVRRLVTQRVDTLMEATRAIADGNFEGAVKISGRDELAALSGAIEQMSYQLKDSIADLDEGRELLQRIINNSPEAIYLTDPTGPMVMMNKVFRDWMGIKAEGMVEPRSTPELHAALGEMNQEVLDGAAEVERELVLFGADNTAKLVEFKKFPVRDATGELIGVGTIGNDVTAQRDTENQLRHAQKMEAVGQLTGGLAHDFNNILQAIVGNLELLNAQLDGQQNVEPYLPEAIEAADRGRRLTQRLLATSRRQILQPKVLNLNGVLNSMADLIRATLGEQIELNYRTEDQLWNCEADVSQIENAILNLAINARDAMLGGGSLIIETANVHVSVPAAGGYSGLPPGYYVRLSATDSGHGMTEEVRERAFEPFFSTKNEGGGSGLGLSTIYGFVQQSGGQVTLTSEPQRGTTVSLYLPRSLRESETRRGEASERPPEGDGQRVLLVEDNAQVRKMTAAMLEHLGYVTVTAETASQALEQIRTEQAFDAVLSDVVLPGGMNGLELADKLTSIQPGLKIQLMSGFVADALDGAHAQDLRPPLQKPFRRSELARSLDELLSSD